MQKRTGAEESRPEAIKGNGVQHICAGRPNLVAPRDHLGRGPGQQQASDGNSEGNHNTVLASPLQTHGAARYEENRSHQNNKNGAGAGANIHVQDPGFSEIEAALLHEKQVRRTQTTSA